MSKKKIYGILLALGILIVTIAIGISVALHHRESTPSDIKKDNIPILGDEADEEDEGVLVPADENLKETEQSATDADKQGETNKKSEEQDKGQDVTETNEPSDAEQEIEEEPDEDGVIVLPFVPIE